LRRSWGKEKGIPISPDEVVITPGGKPIMFFTILALVMTETK